MDSLTEAQGPATIHILRHGQAVHNVQRGYPHRDPPLTENGEAQARAAKSKINVLPDLIAVSPMTRTLQTTLLAFDTALGESSPKKPEVRIWPDLREAYDAICNKGVARDVLAARFPQFDFSDCRDEWDYPAHSVVRAEARAENVRRRLKELAGSYRNIFLVTHRGFAAFLVQGERFDVGECRRYRIATMEESEIGRYGVNKDTELRQDFGPTVLFPYQDDE